MEPSVSRLCCRHLCGKRFQGSPLIHMLRRHACIFAFLFDFYLILFRFSDPLLFYFADFHLSVRIWSPFAQPPRHMFASRADIIPNLSRMIQRHWRTSIDDLQSHDPIQFQNNPNQSEHSHNGSHTCRDKPNTLPTQRRSILLYLRSRSSKITIYGLICLPLVRSSF